MNSLFDDLQRKNLIWRGGDSRTPSSVQNSVQGIVQGSGFAEFDAHIPGGLPQQGVVEIDSPLGIGELRLLLPFFQQPQNSSRSIAFIAPLGVISAELLAQAGIELSRIILVQSAEPKEALWAAEQCLKSGACCAVNLWYKHPSITQVKRLQLAAEQGRCTHFLFSSRRARQISLPVVLSLQLQPHPQGLLATIKKRKGGWSPHPFVISMAENWPDLTCRPLADNVIAFPMRRARAG